jgi:hypothetical protein
MTQSFSIRELTYSDTAIRLGIDNTPTDEILKNLQNVIQFILEPISNNFDSQIMITSGYRSPALCQAIGSKPTSQHTLGMAVDFEKIVTHKKEYNESLEELNIISEQLKKSQYNIEELNLKYSLMKKTLLKTMDQYETLKDSFDDDGENNEKNTLFCTFDNLMPPIPFVYNK